MATLGWKPIGDPRQRLLAAIAECCEAWGEDPAYKEARFKLEQVQQDLDLTDSSPGHRAAMRATLPAMTGQEPTNRSEPPMEAQEAQEGY